MQRGHGLYNGTFANKAVLVSSDEEKETRLFKNVKLLRFFDHPNIVRLQGYSALWKPVLLLMDNMSGKLWNWINYFAFFFTSEISYFLMYVGEWTITTRKPQFIRAMLTTTSKFTQFIEAILTKTSKKLHFIRIELTKTSK